jgi:AcrR family transcriptional regulator
MRGHSIRRESGLKSATRLAAGRPPALTDDARKALILQAAERVFDELGYGEATMEEVARACGMAKKSVYKLFPDKAALFGALIDSHDIPKLKAPGRARPALTPEEQLSRVLNQMCAYVLSPRQILLTRLVISEAGKAPELSERFYRDCVVKGKAFIVGELERQGFKPLDDGPTPDMLADMFVGATLGTLHLRALMLGADPAELQRELEQRVSFAARMLPRLLATGGAETGDAAQGT